MEELLRQAFQLGQQWVQDMNNDKEPTNFNDWYASDEVQEQVKNCSIPAVSGLACKCGNQTFTHRHSNWIECTACDKIQVLQA
jgi:hypothetical protein